MIFLKQCVYGYNLLVWGWGSKDITDYVIMRIHTPFFRPLAVIEVSYI